jgi:hypothetical protein
MKNTTLISGIDNKACIAVLEQKPSVFSNPDWQTHRPATHSEFGVCRQFSVSSQIPLSSTDT